MGDAAAVYANSRDFLERSLRINRTAEALADWLRGREEVSHIYYPKFTRDVASDPDGDVGDGTVEPDATGYASLLNYSLQKRH